MMKARKNYSGQEKVAILKRHLIGKEPVSQICEDLKLNPNVFYKWQKQFFENGASIFESQRQSSTDIKDRAIQRLEKKLKQKNEVVAEMAEEFVKLKKELGEL